MNENITIIPHLTCDDAPAAYEFYQRAFGAAPLGLLKAPDGSTIHAALGLGGGRIHLNGEFPQHGVRGPKALGGTAVTVHLQVPDCDAVYAKAVEAGCAATMPLEDMFWGDRFGMVTDPFGHQWSIATTKQTLSMDEMQEAMEAAMAKPAPI